MDYLKTHYQLIWSRDTLHFFNFSQQACVKSCCKNFLETLLNILNFPAISADINIFAQSPLTEGSGEKFNFCKVSRDQISW